MSWLVLHPGTQSMIVDSGNPKIRHRGISLGGPADRTAWQIGNALAGNSWHASALEITLSGPTLQATQAGFVAFFGAPFRIMIDGIEQQPASSFAVKKDQILQIHGCSTGARGYLCCSQGSWCHHRQRQHLPSGITLQKGDELHGLSLYSRPRTLPCFCVQELFEEPLDRPLRVLKGPQHHLFDWSQFLSQTFRVTTASNRMGLRLRGDPLIREPQEMISEPVAIGTIQVTNEGQAIILGVDGQTIGGYPKLAQVIAADYDQLGQIRPGQAIRFQEVTLPEAEELWHTRNRLKQRWLRRIQAHHEPIFPSAN